MQNDDESYLKRRLLSPPPPPPAKNTDRVRIENEKNNMSSSTGKKSEADLRLHDAVCEGVDEVVELLEENPDLIFERDDENRTPLHTLCKDGDEEAPEILKVLLGVKEGDGSGFRVERGHALHATDDQGFTPLHYAARNWFPELVEALLKYGAKAEAQNSLGDSPLHLAAEGNIEGALECAKIILQYDKDGSLINMKNLDEISPLHRAVKEQAGKMVDLLLQKEYKLNLSALVNLKGQNILQYLCVEPGETEKSCEILKALIKSCNPAQLNSVDQDGRTVLHISAIERLPQITEILVADERVDVMILDKRNRTALHYAAENGSYPDGYKCVEHLISRKFARTKIQIEYLYEICDDGKATAFQLACLNAPMDTMHKYLEAIREPQFWMSETNMTLVYKQCPLAIKGLMDAAFSERKKSRSSLKDEIVTDFGPITGYKDPIEKLQQQETKYLKNALFWDYETQKEILTHPLVQLFVVKKCQKLRAIIYSWLVWQFIWLTAYTLMALSTYTGVINSGITSLVASVIILLYIIISFINEIFELVSVGFAYVWSVSNLFQWIQIVLGFLAIFPVLTGMDLSNIEGIQPFKNCAAIGILLAYILSMRDIGKLHEEIGLVVEVLKQVVIQIVKVLLCCFPLLAGFTLSFVILFDDDDSLNTTFPGPLVKVLVMMAGELEFNDTFKTAEEGGSEASIRNRAIRLCLFLSFLICVPVAFFNLLTGFALERVMELRERAKVGRIAKQLEHIYFIESILLSLSPLKKLLPHGRIVRLLRRYNVTTAMIDGDLKFETFICEETQKKVDRRTAKEKRLDFCSMIRSIFGTELAPDVRHQIFALASQQSHNIKQK